MFYTVFGGKKTFTLLFSLFDSRLFVLVFGMRNFRDLLVWQKGFQIVQLVYRISSGFPREEKFGLAQQMNRASISIVSNIAEGCSRRSTKDFNRFLGIALGSVFELETQLLLANSLSYSDPALIQEALSLVIEEEKMLVVFSRSLQKPSSF